MFGFSPVQLTIQMLRWLTFRLLQAFLTCKDNFIESVFDVWSAGRYLRMFCMHQYVVCICLVRKGKILFPSIPYSTFFIHDMIIPNVCVSGDDVLSDFGISFLCQSGSLYIFCKVPTSLWLLVNVRTYVHYLYTCWF